MIPDNKAVEETMHFIVDQVALAAQFEAVLGERAQDDLEISPDEERVLLAVDANPGGNDDPKVAPEMEVVVEGPKEEAVSKAEAEVQSDPIETVEANIQTDPTEMHEEQALRYSERMIDSEKRHRWTNWRQFTYPSVDGGPPQLNRKSLLQLIEEQVAPAKGKTPKELLNTKEGRSLLNPYLREKWAFVPEMTMLVRIDYAATQSAWAYVLDSKGKPPYNEAPLPLAVIFLKKSMPLRHPNLNLIVTDFGVWPAERLMFGAHTILDQEEAAPSNRNTGYGGRNSGTDARKRPSNDDHRRGYFKSSRRY